MNSYSKGILLRILITFISEILFISKIIGQDNNLIDLSGTVKNSYNEFLAGVKIKIKNKQKITITDDRGMFNMIAEKRDSVIMTYPGYKKGYIYISDTNHSSFYSVDFILFPDTIVIDAVTLLPWKTYEDFKQAFLSNVPADNKDKENAIQNIALIQSQIWLYNNPDPNLNYKQVIQQQFDKSSHLGMAPTWSILNPFAWADFIKSIKDGTLTHSKDIPAPPKEEEQK